MPRAGQRIAITGLGLVSALGGDADTTFERLCSGASGIRKLTLFDSSALANDLAAEVDVAALDVPLLSRSNALALTAAREALRAARLPPDVRRGLALGGTTGSMLETEADLARAEPNSSDFSRARRFVMEPLSYGVEALARALGSTSVASTVCSACSSGAVAIALAAQWILSGRVEAALAGGADALCRMTYAGFAALGVMDRAPCRPFDTARAGLTLGEGAGFLLLEAEESAVRRGAPILGWLSGWALGAEAHHVTHPEPSGARAALLIREAIARGGRTPSEVDYVNAHGTGTPANDRMEAVALRQAFAEHLGRVWVSSNKGQLGHTLGAAGAIEAAITVQSLNHRRLPPTVGLETAADPDLRHVRGKAVDCAAKVAISCSFGFGGMDAVLLFEHRDTAARAPAKERRSVVISAVASIVGQCEFVGEDAAAIGSAEADAMRVTGDPLARLDAERSRRFDRGMALATRCGVLCLAKSELATSGVGLVLGGAYGAVERSLKFLDRLLTRGLKSAAPAEFPQLVPSGPAGNAAIYLGLTGPVFAASEGSTSGESAFAAALHLVETGLSEAMLAGAAEARDPVVAELAPSTVPRTEGAGFLLLESESAARRRGHAALARITGHEELRLFAGSRATSKLLLRAPRTPAQARLLVVGVNSELERELAESPWRDVVRIPLVPRMGFFEAAGAVAFTVAAAWIGRGATEVLLINASERVAYLTRLEPGATS
jgi:3-oxoacyl-[acyl-carrier-protein] synthase II